MTCPDHRQPRTITRKVADAALMLDVMAGRTPRPSFSRDSPYFATVVAGDLAITGTRVAWLDDLGFVPLESGGARDLRKALEVVFECLVAGRRGRNRFRGLGRGPFPAQCQPTRASSIPTCRTGSTTSTAHGPFARSSAAQERDRAASAEMVQAAIYQRGGTLEHHTFLVLPHPDHGVSSSCRLSRDDCRPADPDPFPTRLTYLFNMTGHPATPCRPD